MRKIILGLSIILISFLTPGCSSSESSDTPPIHPVQQEPEYRVFSGGTVDFMLSSDENVLLGEGCTEVELYQGSIKIGSNTYDDGTSLPRSLLEGNYSAFIAVYAGRYSSAKGILYYKSSNFKVDDAPLNTSILVPNRTADIYKLSVSQTSSYKIQYQDSIIEGFDSQLNSWV